MQLKSAALLLLLSLMAARAFARPLESQTKLAASFDEEEEGASPLLGAACL